MNRREFLKLAGLGVVAVAVPKSLIKAQPEIAAAEDWLKLADNKPIEDFASDVGGYLVPLEFHEQLLKALKERSPFSRIAEADMVVKDWPSRSVKVEDYG